MDFLDRVGHLVEDYEAEHHPTPDAEPRAVLRFLMEQHELKQTDLSEEGDGMMVEPQDTDNITQTDVSLCLSQSLFLPPSIRSKSKNSHY